MNTHSQKKKVCEDKIHENKAWSFFYHQWGKMRKEKQFEKADKIRDELNEMNIELIDHKERTIWMKKEKIKSEK